MPMRTRDYSKGSGITGPNPGGTGCSPDSRHAEAGYGIVIDRDRAVSLGWEFQQEAILWMEDNGLFLIICAGGDAVSLGDWESRVHEEK